MQINALVKILLRTESLRFTCFENYKLLADVRQVLTNPSSFV